MQLCDWQNLSSVLFYVRVFTADANIIEFVNLVNIWSINNTAIEW